MTGKKAGVIVVDAKGEVIEREGAFVLPKETLVGGWAKVFIKGHDTPEYAAVGLEEYIGRKKNGEVNSNWSKRPATMIRKVAVVQALREAFPDRFQGLYAQEEFPESSDVKLNTDKIVKEEIMQNANTEDFDVDVEDAEVREADASEPDDVVKDAVPDETPEFMK